MSTPAPISSTRNSGIALAVLSAIVFGIYPAASAKSYGLGANATFIILLTTFMRATAFAMLSLHRGNALRPTQGEFRPMFLGGFFQAVSILGILGSLLFIPGPVMITIVFTHTIFLLLYMAWRGEAHLTRLNVLCTIVALVGVALVVDLVHNLSITSLTGIALAFISSLATTVRTYVFGKEVQKTDPAVLGARVFATALLFCLPLLFVSAPRLPLAIEGFAWAAASGVALSLGSIFAFYAIRLLGSFRFSLTLKLEPIFTAFFSFALLGQLLRPTQYLGMGLVLASLMIFQLLDRKS